MASQRHAPSWTLHGRRSPLSSRTTDPDASSYCVQSPDATSKMPKSPRFSFGSSSTGRLETPVKSALSPGPGSYSHKEYVKPATSCTGSSAHRLPGTPRQNTRSNIGSGSPSRDELSTSSKGCSSSRSLSGFETYRPEPNNTSRMNKSPRWSFGSSSTGRLDLMRDGGPGPGSYETLESSCEKCLVFDFDYKHPSHDQWKYDELGPGLYDIPCTFGDGPKFSVSPRREHRSPDVPGPGAYNVSSTL